MALKAVGLLGPVEAWSAEGERIPLGPLRQQTVFAVLALHVNLPVSAAALVDEVWGELGHRTGEAQALDSLGSAYLGLGQPPGPGQQMMRLHAHSPPARRAVTSTEPRHTVPGPSPGGQEVVQAFGRSGQGSDCAPSRADGMFGRHRFNLVSRTGEMLLVGCGMLWA